MAGPVAALLKGPGVRFAAVGGSLTLLDLALYQLLANVLRVSPFGADPAVAAVWIGVPVVITVNFFVSHRFVWHSTTSKARTVVPFFGLNLFSGVLVQSAVIWCAVSAMIALGWYGAQPGACNLLAKLLAVGVGMVINFLGAKRLFKWQSD